MGVRIDMKSIHLEVTNNDDLKFAIAALASLDRRPDGVTSAAGTLAADCHCVAVTFADLVAAQVHERENPIHRLNDCAVPGVIRCNDLMPVGAGGNIGANNLDSQTTTPSGIGTVLVNAVSTTTDNNVVGVQLLNKCVDGAEVNSLATADNCDTCHDGQLPDNGLIANDMVRQNATTVNSTSDLRKGAD
jgi:hypothetical protein